MPFEFSNRTFEAGETYLRVDVSGDVALADAVALDEQLARPEYLHGKVLSIVAKGTVYLPEARKYFPTLNNKYCAMAAVVSSPIVRAAINMMVRLVPQSHFKMFKDEASALAWLERQPRIEDR